jgi:hypothetical protein
MAAALGCLTYGLDVIALHHSDGVGLGVLSLSAAIVVATIQALIYGSLH